MKSKGNAPTAKQRRWYQWAADHGCILNGDPAEIHHVVGSSARSDKIKIGNDYILPLSYWNHRDYNNLKNIDLWRTRFEKAYGTQKQLFVKLVDHYKDEHGGEMPFDQDVYNAIMRY